MVLSFLFQVKRGIYRLREEVTEQLWNYTRIMRVYKEDDFAVQASEYLKSFEDALLKAMTKDGWDGEEEEKIIQWSFTGSLFYSIIVITTIGECFFGLFFLYFCQVRRRTQTVAWRKAHNLKNIFFVELFLISVILVCYWKECGSVRFVLFRFDI